MTLASALAYGSRIISLSGLDTSLLRTGLGKSDVRDVRGIEVLVPNILSVTAGAAIGAIFCWAGAGLELADLTVRWLLLEFAVLLSVCLLLAWSLSHLRSRAD